MFSRVSLQGSCWHVLSSVVESKAAPTRSSCPSGTDRFLRHSWHFVPGRLRRLRRARQPGVCATIFFGRDVGFAESGYSHKSLRDNKSRAITIKSALVGFSPGLTSVTAAR